MTESITREEFACPTPGIGVLLTGNVADPT